MYFDEKALSNKSTAHKSPIMLPQSRAIMARSLKESKTTFRSSDPKQLCNSLKQLLQEKQA